MSVVLTEHLPLISAAPGGIQKVRGLILELAVRGKLVPQIPTEEPVRDLLQRIAQEQARLQAAGIRKKRNPALPVEEDEQLFPIPKNWRWARLEQLVLGINSGGTPSKSNPSFWKGNIPWASVKDLGFGVPLTFTQDYITSSGLEAGSFLAKAGSILICTRMGLGKIGEAMIDVAINQDLKALKLSEEIHKQYFINFFKTLSIKGSGVTVAGIKQDALLQFAVPIPPLSEQHRIVAKVEELMALCDRLEGEQADTESAQAKLVETFLSTLTQSTGAADFAANWQRLAEHFDTLFTTESSVELLKQSILELAVKGTLVSQESSDEPASELLRKNHKDCMIDFSPCNIEGSKNTASNSPVFSLPPGWAWVRSETVANFIDPHPSHRTPPEFEGGVPYIGYAEIDHNSGIDFAAARKVSPQVYKEHRDRYDLKIGDFVFGKIGTLGQPFFLPEPFDYCLSANLILIQPNQLILNPKFLATFLDSPSFIREMSDKKTNSTHGVFGIKKARSICLPLPPLAEQHRIVARVDELMGICDCLKEYFIESRSRQAQLASTLIDFALKAA